ncbi:Preprotein translocase subunit YajC [Salmonella sp. NCTC 11881]|nr:Preprotein translocase subunit YajC [Salmonella sp. NCTC 11881]
MSFFISDAVAATGAPAQGSPMSLILMLVVFGLIFYFMILRPQQKRTKEHKKLMDSIAKGDEVSDEWRSGRSSDQSSGSRLHCHRAE